MNHLQNKQPVPPIFLGSPEKGNTGHASAEEDSKAVIEKS
jgi:hypothetical protein